MAPPPPAPVLLVDVSVMGARAFEEGRLRELLESTRVLKLVFDCRGDSDALYHQHSVKLRNVYDVQGETGLRSPCDPVRASRVVS